VTLVQLLMAKLEALQAENADLRRQLEEHKTESAALDVELSESVTDLRRQLAEARKGRCYDCGGVGCDGCDGTGDAGTQTLKLKNRVHEIEVKLEEAERERGYANAKLEEAQREYAAEHAALVAQSAHAFREHEEARGEAQRTVYVAADSAGDAVKSAPWWPTEELATMVKGVVGEHVYAVTLTARRVKP